MPGDRVPASNVKAVTPTADPHFLVLHALRLKKFASDAAVAQVTQLSESDARRALEAAVAGELATYRDGRITGWALTPAGRARHRDLLLAEGAATDARAAIQLAYDKFLAVNTELLTVCTDWQLRSGELNDHTDRSYDRGVVERLGDIDDYIQPVCADLAAALSRFAPYGPRLANARRRIESGEGDWFAKPMIDSYHTVWFELHEDLLVTLGLERSKETAS